MNPRSVAGLLGVGMLVVLLVVAAQLPVPYVTVSPGPTIDVLGENGDDRIVRVEGKRTYPTDGELRLTTVSVTNPDAELSLLDALGAWAREDVAVLPFEVMYPVPTSTEAERAESAAQMVNSQDTAIAAALTELGYDLSTYAVVTGITPGGPSEDVLKPRDRVLSVAGAPVDSVEDLFEVMGGVRPGEEVEVVVRRGGGERTFEVTTVPAEDDPDRALIGILVGTGYDFPFQVSVGIDETIGGPSAGLMFALSVYDTLTPGALTDGEIVAGTGTISADGQVGPIGGIRQKIAGAEDSGAVLFLVPPANCAAALEAEVDDIELVRADTMASAVASLEAYADDPTADLPRCSA